MEKDEEGEDKECFKEPYLLVKDSRGAKIGKDGYYKIGYSKAHEQAACHLL